MLFMARTNNEDCDFYRYRQQFYEVSTQKFEALFLILEHGLFGLTCHLQRARFQARLYREFNPYVKLMTNHIIALSIILRYWSSSTTEARCLPLLNRQSSTKKYPKIVHCRSSCQIHVITDSYVGKPTSACMYLFVYQGWSNNAKPSNLT